MTLASAVAIMAATDHRLMYQVNRWRAPRWLRWWMIAATCGGDGWLWVLCGVLILASGQASGHAAIASAALAAGAGVLLFRILKRVVGRQRPCAIAPHCWSTLVPPDQFSFPSGHSITAFAVTVPVALFYPSLAGMLLFCATSIAVSRVVLGMHFLTDVLVGSAIGAVLGYVAFGIVNSIH